MPVSRSKKANYSKKHKKSNKDKKGKSHKHGNSKRKSKTNKSKRSQSSKSSKRSNRSNRSSRNMRGGHYGSDWISSQYSLGSYNSAEQSADYVKQFSASGAGSRADYMNPPNLGSAGSGGAMGELEGAGVQKVGSPVI
jgi:hypothetical protein